MEKKEEKKKKLFSDEAQCHRIPVSQVQNPRAGFRVSDSQQAMELVAGGEEREGKGCKLHTCPTVEFILELHPTQQREEKQRSYLIYHSLQQLLKIFWNDGSFC